MWLSVLLVKRNITLDAVTTWTQHIHSQQLVDHLVIQRRKAPLRWNDQVSHECLLAPHSPCIPEKNSRRRTWQFRRIHHDTLALLNAIHTSCSIHSGCLKIIILLDITDKFNSLTFEPKSPNVRCPISAFGDPAWSWLWFPFPGCFLLPAPLLSGWL